MVIAETTLLSLVKFFQQQIINLPRIVRTPNGLSDMRLLSLDALEYVQHGRQDSVGVLLGVLRVYVSENPLRDHLGIRIFYPANCHLQ